MFERMAIHRFFWVQAIVFILAGILLIVVPELLSWLIAFVLIWIGIMMLVTGFLFKQSHWSEETRIYF
jgi:uncharacterized membrane protein